MQGATKDYGRFNCISRISETLSKFDFSYLCLYNFYIKYVRVRRVPGRSIFFTVGGLEMKVSSFNYNMSDFFAVFRPGR